MKKLDRLRLRLYIDLNFIFKVITRKIIIKEPKEGEVVLACAINEGFIMQLATMLKSIEYNLKSYKKVKVYVLTNSISKENKNSVERSLNQERKIEVIWIGVNEEKVKDLKVDGHISIEAYYRLLMADVLPEDIDKIIYLDCDLILNDDIGKLWNIEIGENFILAVVEGYASMSSSSLSNFYKELSLPPDSKIFNSGVLVINMKRWREFSVGNRIVNFIKKNKDRIIWHDQDGLNAVLAGKWKELDPRWNVTSYLIEQYPFFKGSVFDKKTTEKIVKSAFIVHFNMTSKPWHKYNKNIYNDLFYFYLDKTEWRGWRP